MKYVISIASLVLMMGCKAQSDVYEFANVPPERFYAFNQKSDALIVVMHSALENGCAITLSIDSVPAAHIISGEKANLGVTIGSHSLSARYGGGCSSQELREIKLGVKAGDALIMDFDNVSSTHSPL